MVSTIKGGDKMETKTSKYENLMKEKEYYEEKLKMAQEDYIDGLISDEEYTDIAADLKRKIDENVYEMKMYKDK